MASLKAVTRALDRGDNEAALEELIKVWRRARHPRLADLIDRLGERAMLQAPLENPILARTKRTTLEHWLAAAAAPSPTLIGHLLELFPLGRAKTTAQQLAAMEGWPDDPRVAGALGALLHRPPPEVRNEAGQTFWDDLLDRVERLGDARALSVMREEDSLLVQTMTEPKSLRLDPDLEQAIADSPDLQAFFQAAQVQGQRLRRRLRERVQAAETRLEAAAPRLSATMERQVAALEQKLVTPRDDSRQEQLLAAVYEHPEDDTARLVYADLLAEQGDPRGEFIALQLQPNATLAQRRRANELLRIHGRRWVGALDQVLQPSKRKFARGFPWFGRILSDQGAIDQTVGDPRWSTLEVLEFDDYGHLDVVPLLTHPTMRALREVHGLRGESVLSLFESEAPCRVRVLTCDTGSFEGRVNARGVPQLEELTLPGVTYPSPFKQFSWVFDSPLRRRLRLLRFTATALGDLPRWLPAAMKLGRPTARLELLRVDGWRWTFGRVKRDRYTELEVRYEKEPVVGMVRTLTSLLGRLPARSLEALTIHLPKESTFTAKQVAAIQKAGRRLKRGG
jgi:uncharacterized protein (TIGR02996 family)